MQPLKYGLKNGTLVHVDSVSNGLSCGCVCPSCGGVLEAHQGEYKQHHFKHHSIIDCDHGSESALHIMAKNIIATTKTVYIPNAPINAYDLFPKGKCYKFEDAFVEKAFSPDIRCDILLTSGNTLLNVEINVTHKIDTSKRIKLYNENLRTIEIDLSDFVDDFNETEVQKIIESGEKTKLIYSPISRDIYAKWLLGEWKEISNDKTGNPYVKKCRFASQKQITYFINFNAYRNDCTARECHECYGGNEFDPNRNHFLCRGLYGNLNYKSIEKIIEIKRENDIVQYAELIVDGHPKIYGKKQ